MREKYNKAHSAYLQHKDTNKTNATEAAFLPIVLQYKKDIFGNRDIMFMPDCLLNYLGADIIASDGTVYDIKVCQHLHNTEVLIDAYSKSQFSKPFLLHKSTEDKLNDFYIFVNYDNIIIVSKDDIEKLIPPPEECFYMKRDLYKTKLKAIVDVKKCRKKIIKR